MIKQNEKPLVKRSPSPARVSKPPSPLITVPPRLSKSPNNSTEPMNRERKPLSIVSKSASSDNNTKDAKPPIISKSPTSENIKQPTKRWDSVPSKTKQLSPRTPTITKPHGLEDGFTEAQAHLLRGKPSSAKAKEPSPTSSSSSNKGSKGSSPSSPSLCIECTRAASEGAVCFIGNDGRVSACTTRSAVRLCKNLNCAANNPEYVAAMASAPKKYLVSKRHQLKALYAPKPRNAGGHLKSPTTPDMPQTPTTPLIHSYSEGEDSSSPQTESFVADSPSENGFENADDEEVSQEVPPDTTLPEFEESEVKKEECGPERILELDDCVGNDREESRPQTPLKTDACVKEGCSAGAPIDCPPEDAELEECIEAATSSNDTGLASANNQDVLSSAISIIESGPEEDDDQSSSGGMENPEIVDDDLDANIHGYMETTDILGANLDTSNGHFETTDIVDVSLEINTHGYIETADAGDIKSETCSVTCTESNLDAAVYSTMESGSNGGMDKSPDIVDSKNDSCSNAGMESNHSIVVINNESCSDDGMEATEDTSYANHESANLTQTTGNDQAANGNHTQTICKYQDANGVEASGKEQGGGLRIQRRRRRVGMVVDAQPNAETVTLRKQLIQERKHAEEWMPNHAIEEVVQKLAPLGETKVKVLVEAFESIIAHTEVDAAADHHDGSRTPPPSV